MQYSTSIKSSGQPSENRGNKARNRFTLEERGVFILIVTSEILVQRIWDTD